MFHKACVYTHVFVKHKSHFVKNEQIITKRKDLFTKNQIGNQFYLKWRYGN